MIKIKYKAQCSGCHACKSICPKNCIDMVRDEEGFLYPKVDMDSCINCGLCEKKCPIITPLENTREEKDVDVYAAYSKDEVVRQSSSSGGLFTEIATNILDKGGVVFGAAFSDDWTVKHIWIEDEKDLNRLRCSKYVQSVIGDAYKEAEVFLKQGRVVFFTGTPCQIGGLYKYLGRAYDNLITQDFICHGVPSPMVWEAYVSESSKRAGSVPEFVSFRDKTKGWKMFSMRMDYKDGTSYVCDLKQDPYMRVFLSDICLRPSCYNCAFKIYPRESDITLADFWGIQYSAPHLNDGKGVSAVFVNSPTGKEMFDSIKESLVFEETSKENVVRSNPSLIRSVQLPPDRKRCIRDVRKKGFYRAVPLYIGKQPVYRLMRKIRCLFK